MIFQLIDLLFALVELALRDVGLVGQALFTFFDCLSAIASVIFVCMPDAIAGVIITSISFIVALKIVQYH